MTNPMPDQPLHEIVADIAEELPWHYHADAWWRGVDTLPAEFDARYAIEGWLQDELDKHGDRFAIERCEDEDGNVWWTWSDWGTDCVEQYPTRLHAQVAVYKRRKEAK